jgi:phosphoglycolate phosphatase
LRTLIDQLGVSTHFDLILGEEDAANKKPAPDLVLVTAAHFGVAPDRILVVGDTTYDIEMGHAAGSHTCAVTYGNHDRTRLQMARPHHYTDALTTLSASLSQ